MSERSSGIRDWIIQRVTAMYILAYIIVLSSYLIYHGVDYASWHMIFSLGWVKIMTIFFFMSLSWHAWIGVWTVITDYVPNFFIRMTLLAATLLAVASYFVWGIQILWGV
ncbi:MAG: succinate dehydrogenase, hydrophobic membrane anchor protein [Gammaproteobacteria bacterium]